MDETKEINLLTKYPLSLNKAAKLFGISYTSIYKLWKDEKIEGARIMGVCRTNEEAVRKAINQTVTLIMPKE